MPNPSGSSCIVRLDFLLAVRDTAVVCLLGADVDLFKFGVCWSALQTKVNSEQMVADILRTKGYDEFVLVLSQPSGEYESLLDGLWRQPAQPGYHNTPFRLHFF
jgi:hypothetical protein